MIDQIADVVALNSLIMLGLLIHIGFLELFRWMLGISRTTLYLIFIMFLLCLMQFKMDQAFRRLDKRIDQIEQRAKPEEKGVEHERGIQSTGVVPDAGRGTPSVGRVLGDK